jgi:multiple sugar transport system permease protein
VIVNRIGIGFRLAIILALVGIAIFPFYWMLTTSLTGNDRLYSDSPQLFPDLSQLGIFGEVLGGSSVRTWLTNSAIVAAGTALLSLAFALPMAYALSRFRFRGKAVVGVGLFMTQMLPEAMLVVPLFSIFSSLKLLDTLAALVLANTAFTLPIVTFILKNAMDGVPQELDEAARMDGSNRAAILTRIILPVVAPSVAAAAVIAFFHGWNEYVFALTFVSSDELRTASVGLAGFVGELATPIQSVMAVGIMYTLPAVAFYLLLQRYIVAGMTAGAVKG